MCAIGWSLLCIRDWDVSHVWIVSSLYHLILCWKQSIDELELVDLVWNCAQKINHIVYIYYQSNDIISINRNIQKNQKLSKNGYLSGSVTITSNEWKYGCSDSWLDWISTISDWNAIIMAFLWRTYNFHDGLFVWKRLYKKLAFRNYNCVL